jgi:hypothetical protein
MWNLQAHRLGRTILGFRVRKVLGSDERQNVITVNAPLGEKAVNRILFGSENLERGFQPCFYQQFDM